MIPARETRETPRRIEPDLLIVLAAAIVLGAVMVIALPIVLVGSPERLTVLNNILAGRSIAHLPYPVGYPLMAAFAERTMGSRGLSVVQAIVYIATVLLAWLTMRGFGVGRFLRLAGGLAVATYPGMVFAITRYVDTVPSCFLLAAFAWLVMRLRRDGLSRANTLIAGVVFGLMLPFRAPDIAVAPVAVWAAFAGRRFAPAAIVRMAAAAAVAIAIGAAFIVPLKGRLDVFDPYQGAYTFANGTHALAIEGILRDYNGEMAMPEAMRQAGLTYYSLDRDDPAVVNMYKRFGMSFIQNHFGRYLELEALKAVNLFRPDYRNASKSFIPAPMGYVIHTMVAAIFFAWLAVRVTARRVYGLLDGLMLPALTILYLAPFVLTNADPRYRFPIDVLLIVDSAIAISLEARDRMAPDRAKVARAVA